jgi:hypothetical protein
MSAMEHEDEPVPGLPQELPEGESIVWQGSPAWRPLARNVFKTRWVAAYFAVLVVARVVMLVSSGEDMTSAAESLATMVVLFAGALGILALMGWLHAPSRRTGS